MLWVVIATFVAAFVVAVGVGGNDLANAFGPVYGARIMSIHKIVLIAGICEFGGSVLLGSEVAKTIGVGISNNKVFDGQSSIFIYGMFSALFAPAFWLHFATFRKLPVSTTHSIVGGVVGMALAFGGGAAVIWWEKKSELPFVMGVVPIVIAWFISPLLNMLLAVVTFWTMRRYLLRCPVSSLRAAVAVGIVAFITFFLDAFFVLYKGHVVHWHVDRAAWVSAIIGTVAGIVGAAITPRLMQAVIDSQGPWTPASSSDDPWQRRESIAAEHEYLPRPQNDGELLPDPEERNEPSPTAEDNGTADVEGQEISRNEPTAEDTELQQSIPLGMTRLRLPVGSPKSPNDAFATSTPFPATPTKTSKKPPLSPRAEAVEKFPRKYEKCFKYLLVYSAVFVAFAHGANDGGELVGAASIVLEAYRQQDVPKTSHVPLWMLACGGAGIVTGSHFFGAKIVELVGDKMIGFSPSRAFVAQFATALMISVFSSWGLPVSSTHCLTFAIIGIGLMEGRSDAIDWNVIRRTAIGWIITLVVACGIAAACFAQAVYAPCVE